MLESIEFNNKFKSETCLFIHWHVCPSKDLFARLFIYLFIRLFTDLLPFIFVYLHLFHFILFLSSIPVLTASVRMPASELLTI